MSSKSSSRPSSKARLVVTAITLENRTVADVVADYGVSKSWVYELLGRYRAEGEAAFELRSKRPLSSPHATPPATVELILRLRKQLREAGLDSGAETIQWHLAHRHQTTVSRATIHRVLTRSGAVAPEPSKRPKSSYIRFEAAMPNETWQSDFTHYRLTTPDGRPGTDTEIITWLDDHSRYALHVTAHQPVTAKTVLHTFRQATDLHGYPASTLTDNGMVYTVRLAGHGRGGGKNAFEAELRRLDIVQKNSRPSRPTTCGKVERFQQTLKKWLRAQPEQPTTLTELQALLDDFIEQYNHCRPHRSLPHRATPATAYRARPKATPTGDRSTDSHDRTRHDVVSTAGNVTLRIAGQLRHIGVGRTYARTRVILLVQDLHVRIVHAATGELLRELIVDPSKDYQPLRTPK
ncbi:MAG: IS481 family transposase [Nocardioides sp.]